MSRSTAPLATLGALPDAVERKRAALASVPAAPPRRVVEALPPVELERPRRPTWPTLAALAIATGLAALGLGGWAVVSELRAEDAAPPPPSVDQSLGVLTDTTAERYPLRGSVNRIVLVVSREGEAVLALDGLGPPPLGSSYRAWLVSPGSATPVPLAEFDASTPAVPLALPVASGARVGVTLEPLPAGARPTRPLRLVAVRA